MRRAPIGTLALLLALPLGALAQDGEIDPDGDSIVGVLGGETGGALGEPPPLVASAEARAAAGLYADLIADRSDAELQMFLTLMPKGGDLHHHYSGAIYAETYLDWVEEKGWTIDPETLRIDKDAGEGTLTVAEVRGDAALYRRVLSAWSILDHESGDDDTPPDAHFFETFVHFGPISTQFYGEGLRRLRDRALAENVLYIETMLASVRYWFRDADVDARLRGAMPDVGPVLDELVDQFEADWRYDRAVDGFVDMVAEGHEGIDSDDFVMRYQAYVYRDMNPSSVFAGLAGAFEAASRSDLVVGVNLVGPENGLVALRDYSLHMRMFQHLKARHPGVHVALHAGELKKGLVPPEDLRFHVREALEVGGAERLGHCLDMPFERRPLELMGLLRERDVPVEVCLTSNEFILGVAGRRHPFLLFARNDVPMVLATDDAGVSRNDLTHEYGLLATRHGVSYGDLKRLAYGSVRYAFADEATKAALKEALDARFADFEGRMAEYAAARAE